MASGPVQLDIHDSRVVSIERQNGVLTIGLEQKRSSATKHLRIKVFGVSREDAEYYVGHNITAQHPDPVSPLDYVEFAEQQDGYLELSGYREREPWFIWRIINTSVEVSELPIAGGAP